MKLKVLSSGSQGNCYILQSENEQLILDCGIGLKQIKAGLGFNISNVAGCVVTHHHSDHDLTSKDLIKMGLSVIRPFDENSKNKTLKRGSCFQVKPIPLTDKKGNWTHLDSDGSICPIYGYHIYHEKLGSLVYCTDTEFIKWHFNGINHFLIESNYDLESLESESEKTARVFKSHMSIQAACKFIQANQNANNIKTVILCHLSSQNGSPDDFKRKMSEVVGEKARVYIAKKGLEIDL